MNRKDEMREKGYKAYEGREIRVYWNPNLCTHVATCWKSNLQVFDPKRRPWVDPNAAPGEEIAAIIDRCPSGALLYDRIGDGEEAESI